MLPPRIILFIKYPLFVPSELNKVKQVAIIIYEPGANLSSEPTLGNMRGHMMLQNLLLCNVHQSEVTPKPFIATKSLAEA